MMMKKILWAVALVLVVAGVAAQERKTLSLEQTVSAVYEKQLIDAQQKQTIDSMIVAVTRERGLLHAAKKQGKLADEQYKVQSKALSENFTKELKEVLRTPESFKKWQTVRYAK